MIAKIHIAMLSLLLGLGVSTGRAAPASMQTSAEKLFRGQLRKAHEGSTPLNALMEELEVDAGSDLSDQDKELYEAASEGDHPRFMLLLEKYGLGDVSGLPVAIQHLAAYGGSIGIMNFLVEWDVDLDKPDPWLKMRPIDYAIMNHRDEMVALLLDKGVSLGGEGKHGLNTMLMASTVGNAAVVEQLLEHGADPNRAGLKDATPLMMACAKGDRHMVEVLLEYGAQVNAKSSSNSKAIHMACRSGYLDIAKLLHEHGAVLDESGANWNRPIHFAARAGHLDVVNWLLSQDVPLERKNSKGKTALFEAARQGFLQVVEALVEKGADIYTRDKDGFSPLHYVSYNDYPRVQKFLLERGVDPDVQAENRVVPLMSATMQGNKACVSQLLDAGANVNARGNRGETAFMIAARKGWLLIAKLLAEHGADVKALSDDGYNAVHVAAVNNQVEMLEYLVSLGVDPRQEDEDGMTPFYKAVTHEAIDAVRFLAQYEEDIDRPVYNDWNALGASVVEGDVALSRALVELGASLNPTNPSLVQTPLVAAVSRNRIPTVKYLLEAGADPDLFITNRWPALCTAANKGRSRLVDLLFEYNADPDIQDEDGWAPLHHLARFGDDAGLLETFLGHGADIDIRDRDGRTPIHVAVHWGATNVFNALMEHGADIHAARVDGRTPLVTAKMQRQGYMEQALRDAGAAEAPSDPEILYVDFEYYNPEAHEVVIAGDFNGWSTLHNQMKQRDDGTWHINLGMVKGSNIAYKLVVDGEWILHPENPEKTEKENGTVNSLYDGEVDYVGPKTHHLEYADAHFAYSSRHAERVYVAGSFNSWSTRQDPLRKTSNEDWALTLSLPVGEYGYKFVVDGEWLMDTNNPLTMVEGGISNSLVIVGEPSDASPERASSSD